MAKRKTLYELAQKYGEFRERLQAITDTPADHWGKDKAYFRVGMLRADATLYAEASARGDGALLPSLVTQVRAETLDELEALARKRGDGLHDVLEILATMRSRHGKT